MDTIVPVLLILLNTAKADRVEIQSRPPDAIVWMDETTLSSPQCAEAGTQIRRAVLSWDRRDPNAFLRARACMGAQCFAWGEATMIQVVTLPPGPWTATGDVGNAGARLPVDASGIPVIIPVTP